MKARELTEGRNIPKAEFIRQLFAAKEVVKMLKQSFRLQLNVDLIVKDTDGSNQAVELNVSTDEIDVLVTFGYSATELDRFLTEA